jgi:DNA-binding response OmpR family regulator
MSNHTILLIDYEPRSVERLRLPLERAGYSIQVAKDGPTGIDLFHEIRPAAVIIEAMLPKRHGFEVCLELKQTPHGAKTPIMIATSVYRGRKYRQQATHQYKADAFLEKPIADEDLLSTVEAAIKHYQAEQASAPAAELEIDASAAQPQPAAPTEQVVAQPPKSAVAVEEDLEFDIVDRLDTLLSDDPSKDSPSGS